jgi:hypothetical protein
MKPYKDYDSYAAQDNTFYEPKNTQGGIKSIVGSKYDYDLFLEENDKKEKIIRVKRTNSTSGGEKWKILENEKIVFVVEGAKISKKEKEYLRTVEGVRFLIEQAKVGIKSVSGLKNELRGRLK